jgi:hypothetical protein
VFQIFGIKSASAHFSAISSSSCRSHVCIVPSRFPSGSGTRDECHPKRPLPADPGPWRNYRYEGKARPQQAELISHQVLPAGSQRHLSGCNIGAWKSPLNANRVVGGSGLLVSGTSHEKLRIPSLAQTAERLMRLHGPKTWRFMQRGDVYYFFRVPNTAPALTTIVRPHLHSQV